jgi:hypothetical protein
MSYSKMERFEIAECMLFRKGVYDFPYKIGILPITGKPINHKKDHTYEPWCRIVSGTRTVPGLALQLTLELRLSFAYNKFSRRICGGSTNTSILCKFQVYPLQALSIFDHIRHLENLTFSLHVVKFLNRS